MIVVPVTINGAGPFNFLLDTGSSNTIIDPKLAKELHLPQAARMNFETAQGESVKPLAHTDSVSMGGVTVRGIYVVLINHYADLLPGIRGCLGEDFLQYFDLLIDNRRQLIEFEYGPGPLGDRLSGEHLPLAVYGLGGEKLTSDRLVVIGQLYEFGNKDAKLLLDSGTSYLLLFSELRKLAIAKKPTDLVVMDIFGSGVDTDAQTTRLRLGNRLFNNVTVMVPAMTLRSIDVDGFLPISLFRSIFISHSERFVILDPSGRSALAQSKPPSRADTEISRVSSLPKEQSAAQ
jgi:predicted aspartyl protease